MSLPLGDPGQNTKEKLAAKDNWVIRERLVHLS